MRQNRCFLYHVIGRSSGEWLVPVGGMGALTAALAQAARREGAELRTGAQVLAIAPDQRGVEVRFGDSQREHAVRAKHVLVGSAPAEPQRLLGADRLLGRLTALHRRSAVDEGAHVGDAHVEAQHAVGHCTAALLL